MPKIIKEHYKVHLSIRDGDDKKMILQSGGSVPKELVVKDRLFKSFNHLVEWLKGDKP